MGSITFRSGAQPGSRVGMVQMESNRVGSPVQVMESSRVDTGNNQYQLQIYSTPLAPSVSKVTDPISQTVVKSVNTAYEDSMGSVIPYLLLALIGAFTLKK